MDILLTTLLILETTLLVKASSNIVHLCNSETGGIAINGISNSQLEFTSASCNTNNPSALMLKFERRAGDCSREGECGALSELQENGERLLGTCGDRTDVCYVFVTERTALEMLSGFGCTIHALFFENRIPNVTFRYRTCRNQALFQLNYTYIEKKPEPTTTPISTTSSLTTETTSEYTTSTNGSSERPDISARSFPLEAILSIVFGVLFLITLLALITLAIRHRRVTSSPIKFPAPLTNSENVYKIESSREVVVNQLYDSVYDQESGGENVGNE